MIRALGALAAVLAGPADAACRQALVLALDISASVDDREYRLQLDGLAEALGRPAVRDAILAMPAAPVDLAVFEWSDPGRWRQTLDWTNLRGPADLDRAMAALRGARRPDLRPSTGLGDAMRTGTGMLSTRPDCWRRTLDISGDGPSNTGPRPRDVRAGMEDVTVNALVVQEAPARGARYDKVAELSRYFREEVLHGPDAFLETARGFADYADAMERKLLRELRVVVTGRAAPEDDGRDPRPQ